MGRDATEIYENLQGRPTPCPLSRTSIFRWARHFEDGKSDIPDGWGSQTKRRVTDTRGIAAIEAVIKEDNRVTVDFVAKKVGISSSWVQRVLHDDLGLGKLSARWVPHILTSENKGVRLEYAQQLKENFKNCDEKTLSKIVTGDETYIYFYEPFRKEQNKSWLPKGASRTKIARRNKSTDEATYTIFFNSKGIVAQIPCQNNQTVNSAFYTKNVLSEVVRFYMVARPCTGTRGIQILHDNALLS